MATKAVKQVLNKNDEQFIESVVANVTQTEVLLLELGQKINNYVNVGIAHEKALLEAKTQQAARDEEIAKIKAKYGLAIEGIRKEAKTITQLRAGIVKSINDLITPLRAAKVEIGPKDKGCPNAAALWYAMGELADQTKSNYLSIIRTCIKDGTKFSSNPSRDKAAKAQADQKSATKGVLETHVKTKDKPVKAVFELVLPELIELVNDLKSSPLSQDLLSALEDALEMAHKLPSIK
jgi:hypothetical protein